MNFLIETAAGLALLAATALGGRRAVQAHANSMIAEAMQLKTSGKYDFARVKLESALTLQQKIRISGGSNSVQAKILLDWILIEQGQDDVAIRDLTQLSAVLEAKNARATDRISACIPVAWVYFVRGDLQSARGWSGQGISLHEHSAHSANVNYASLLCVQAMCCLKLNELADAEELLERSLSIVERETGKMSLYCAPIMTNLGWLRLLQGRTIEGLQLWQRSCSIYAHLMGTDHPRARRVANLLIEYKRIYAS
jgi:tetratricopeptide (TPR) repeat protein